MTAFRFLIKKAGKENTYYWIRLGFWTRWRPKCEQHLIWSVEIDDEEQHPTKRDEVIAMLTEKIRKARAQVYMSSRFGWHPVILQVVSQEFDDSVWGVERPHSCAREKAA